MAKLNQRQLTSVLSHLQTNTNCPNLLSIWEVISDNQFAFVPRDLMVIFWSLVSWSTLLHDKLLKLGWESYCHAVSSKQTWEKVSYEYRSPHILVIEEDAIFPIHKELSMNCISGPRRSPSEVCGSNRSNCCKPFYTVHQRNQKQLFNWLWTNQNSGWRFNRWKLCTRRPCI